VIVRLNYKGENAMNQDQIEKHSTAQSVILHLLPGILVGCFYFLALKPVAKMGYPFFCPIFGLRFYSCSRRTRISFSTGEEKNGSVYTSGNHQLSEINPVVAILLMGNHYFRDCRRINDTL
jgi:hypothetical protein